MGADLRERRRDTTVSDARAPGFAALGSPSDDAVWQLLFARSFRDDPDRSPDDDAALSAWARQLSTVAPGPALATLLDLTDPSALSDGELVEMVAAAERLAAWAHAQSTSYAAALARRPAMRPTGSPSTRPEDGCVAGDELAMRLAASRRAAAGLVAEGIAYDGLLAPTGDALRAGSIDARRARILVDRLRGVDGEVAWEVQGRVLPDAGRRTVTQLRRDVDRVLSEVDGAHAADRHRAARRERKLTHPLRLADGMAAMWWVLPAHDAARIDGLMDSAARRARSAGDPRTLDQLRADGLRDLVLDPPEWVRSLDVDGTGAPGAHTAHQDRCLPDLDPQHLPTPDDHRLPDPRHRCTRPHEATTVHVTVALSTLLGQDDAPGDLHGFGPIDADQTRDLAFAADATWRRLVTDPLSGAVLDVGRTRYRPPAPLAAHIRARDRRCARPGCDVAAERCDLDHTIEFHGRASTPPGTDPPAPGSTSADNLGPLCRRDHRLKSGAGFVLRQPEPGVFEWLTPTGHRYRLRPGADRACELLGASGDGRGGRSDAAGRSTAAAPSTRENALTQAERDARDGMPPF